MNNLTPDASSRGPVRTVAVVARNPQADVLDALVDAGDYDVVFVEAIESAYSSIKRVTPHLVIVCLEVADAESVQLLSMLSLDADTASIPVRAYVVPPGMETRGGGGPDVARHRSAQPMALSMN